jgi:hypothetical protein
LSTAAAIYDPVQLALGERVGDERLHRLGHEPAALAIGGEPVADRRRPVLPVEGVEAGDTRDRPVGIHERELHARVLVELAARRADEFERVVRRGDVRHPRQPGREVRAVSVRQREQLAGVGLLEGPQARAAGEVDLHRRESSGGVDRARCRSCRG